MLEREAAEGWICEHVQPTGSPELVRERPWSTVLRVPLPGRDAWFKACSPVQAFEPRLSAELHARWPGRVGEVMAFDDARGWLLLADAGVPLREVGNPPEAWLEVLPRYAELQRGEVARARKHLAQAVPSLQLSQLPEHYHQLVEQKLPLQPAELDRLRVFSPEFERLCIALADHGLPATVEHGDLHMGSVYRSEGELRILDWGDASISHPFFSLTVTFRFLEENTDLDPADPWFVRLRDAYLEPWGAGYIDAFDIALRVGRFAHAIGWDRHRGFLPPGDRAAFDEWFAHVLRRALRLV